MRERALKVGTRVVGLVLCCAEGFDMADADVELGVSRRTMVGGKVVAWKCQNPSQVFGAGEDAGIFTRHPFISCE